MRIKQRRGKLVRIVLVVVLTVLFVTVGLVFAYVGESPLSGDKVSTGRSLDTIEDDSPARYRHYLDAAESASIEYDSPRRYRQYLDAIDQAQLAQGASLTAEFASIKNDGLRYQQYQDAIERAQQAQSVSLAAELLDIENDSAIRFQQYLDAIE